MGYLIKETTKQERIELIRSWVPDDEVMDGCDIDLWEMYRDYIDGKREISEINASFNNPKEGSALTTLSVTISTLLWFFDLRYSAVS